MTAAGVLLIIAVVLIVAALVFFLVSVIFALQKITKGLDETIAAVGEIVEKSEPVNAIVEDINANLDAAVDALEGLLVKKAGLPEAMGLIEGLYPGAKAEGLRNFPDSATVRSPRISEVYTRGTLDARATRPRSTDRRRQPERPGPARRALRQPRLARALSRPTGPAAPRSSAPTRPSSTRPQMQTPAPFEYERATSLQGAIASLKEHEDSRDHRRRALAAADDEAAAREPDAADRHQRPHGPAVHPRGGRRDRHRRFDAPRRAAQVRAARAALPALPRRGDGHRRPRGAQPRDDRRLALPGRRGRGPVRGVRGA